MATILLAVTFIGQTAAFLQTAGDEEKEAAAARLRFMKESAAVYEISRGVDGKTGLKLLPDPVLRWNNPVSSVPDGSLFLWVGPDGRPEVAAQVFIAAGTKDLWLHEFQSLSLDSLAIVRDQEQPWHPRKPGMELKIVDDAPVPAETAVKRLAQMRKIAQDFEAADDFEGASRWELRLLSKPLQRYGRRDSEILDGALFAFAHGTDPEVFLALEARSVSGEYRWHYGLAPMTAYAVKASYKGQSVWNRPQQKPPFSPDEPFFILKYAP
jgi:hypothetical protein